MTAQGFRDFPERDSDWIRESRRETVRSVLVTEKRAFATNVVAVAAFSVAAFFLPNALAFALPIVMRCLALLGAHLSYIHLRNLIDTPASLDGPLRLLAVMLLFGGMSWAYLLLPVITLPNDHPLSLIFAGGVMVGVALIVTMTASLRVPTLAFIVGFLGTMAFGLTYGTDEAVMPSVIGMSAVAACVVAFAFATAKQREFSADMLVENRRLNEDLAEALAQAEFLAAHDPLTGLYNRRALFETDLAKDAVSDRMHMLLIDLDHFKAINDTYGHDVGDRTLVEISNLLREAIRGHGSGNHFAVRLGGEEFAVFLDDQDDQNALVFSEDLRGAISTLHEVLDLPAGATSASIGLTFHVCGAPLDETMRRADKAMYGAKQAGRNQVRRVDR